MSKVFKMIREEKRRQRRNIELIASENFVSRNVRRAVGSCLTNKYCEGYPALRHDAHGKAGRYYGGCDKVDKIEEYCCDKWREVFRTDYHVNVQPHSGSQANFAAYAAVLKPGDTILSLSLNNGGHLTHGSPVNFSGKLYNTVNYGVDKNGYIDMIDFRKKLYDCDPAPRLVVVGASAYPREIDFKAFRDIIDDYNNEYPWQTPVLLMVDMAHIAGLVAAGYHQSPFGIADIITTTTHKTLRGPRGGLIFCKPQFSIEIDKAVFPYSQGGPLMHVIAGKAVCAEEALKPSFKRYIKRVINNCWAMESEFKKQGIKLVTGGTDNHLLLIDLTNTHPHVNGLYAQMELDTIGITVNKNCVPNEIRSPKDTSGLRIGTAAMTTRGWGPRRFRRAARQIADLLDEHEEMHRVSEYFTKSPRKKPV